MKDLGVREADNEGNSVTLEVKSQVPGKGQMCRIFFQGLFQYM